MSDLDKLVLLGHKPHDTMKGNGGNMTKKLSKKKIEQISNQIYNKTCKGVQFDIMELGKVTGPAKAILANGGTTEEATAQMIKDRDENRLN